MRIKYVMNISEKSLTDIRDLILKHKLIVSEYTFIEPFTSLMMRYKKGPIIRAGSSPTSRRRLLF
jgi:hypothetical protein